MTKVMLEIEIPDGHEVVRGPTLEWSGAAIVEATGLDDKSRAIGFSVITRPAKPLLIRGQPAEWPDWLTCDWVAKDRDGLVCGYLNEPQKYGDYDRWRSDGSQIILSNGIDIDIPGPWDQSLRENPRRKK